MDIGPFDLIHHEPSSQNAMIYSRTDEYRFSDQGQWLLLTFSLDMALTYNGIKYGKDLKKLGADNIRNTKNLAFFWQNIFRN